MSLHTPKIADKKAKVIATRPWKPCSSFLSITQPRLYGFAVAQLYCSCNILFPKNIYPKKYTLSCRHTHVPYVCTHVWPSSTRIIMMGTYLWYVHFLHRNYDSQNIRPRMISFNFCLGWLQFLFFFFLVNLRIFESARVGAATLMSKCWKEKDLLVVGSLPLNCLNGCYVEWIIQSNYVHVAGVITFQNKDRDSSSGLRNREQLKWNKSKSYGGAWRYV